jgi:hypothetical protein
MGRFKSVAKVALVSVCDDLRQLRHKAPLILPAIAMMACMALSQVVHAEATIPTTGVDIGAYATAAITALGAVVLVIIGGYFAFKLIKLGLRWVGKLGG